MLTRRAVLASAAAVPVAAYAADAPDAFQTQVAALEKKSGGRIGVAAYDTGARKRIAWRADERFLMCSTFKLLLVTATLKRIDQGKEDPRRHVAYTQADFVGWAPVTRQHVAEGMNVIDLCAAAISYSDNTAANLLYAPLGGPAALQHFARTDLSDWISSLDRIEPALNVPDGDKDTTMPSAMLGNLRGILLEDVLKPESRKLILGWMIGNRTGDTFLRAGLPKGWQAGDKTGTGSGAHNDLAIATPPGRAPILISAYTMGCGTPDNDKGTLADLGRIVAGAFA
ncbi:MAG: class A beta-lactamase [Alphaproteobacteria bacterium]|nr:class A beta-lactamase [Alphaproteobacteria bacterium]MBL7098493.1 class A beta-lactamase [Alphaproteobacteria bacterium]